MKVFPEATSVAEIPPTNEEIEARKEMLSGLRSETSTTASSFNHKYPTARELSETFSNKVTEMKWVFLSFGVNIFLLYYFVQMQYGLLVYVPIGYVETFSCVVIEVLLLFANIITCWALDDGAAAFFGWRMAKGRGYSIAVAGFLQTSSFFKFNFVNELSLNSTCRKLLSRITIFFVLLDFLKLLTPLAATALSKSVNRIDQGQVACFLFSETNEPVDRGYPTIQYTEGYAELIFGTALGNVRSEFNFTNTTAVMAPQIVGAVNDGDTITGPGYLTTVLTSCTCSTALTSGAVMAIADHLTSQQANDLLTQFNAVSSSYNLINHLEQVNSSAVLLTTMISSTILCSNLGSPMVPVCVTSFSEHKNATVQIGYMTDGTPSSIAAKEVTIREVGTDANTTWVYHALKNILTADISVATLPVTVPGILNPLMWWTTPNLVNTDPALLEAGLETSFTMLLRAGMQRSYNIEGSSCVTRISDPGSSTLTMHDYGVSISIFILTYQLVMSFVALVGFIPWILKHEPIGPAIRVLREPIYFITLLQTSQMNYGLHDLCNAQHHQIWQALDIICRVGESIQSNTEEVGHVIMTKPKLVKSLVNGRKYY